MFEITSVTSAFVQFRSAVVCILFFVVCTSTVYTLLRFNCNVLFRKTDVVISSCEYAPRFVIEKTIALHNILSTRDLDKRFLSVQQKLSPCIHFIYAADDIKKVQKMHVI